MILHRAPFTTFQVYSIGAIEYSFVRSFEMHGNFFLTETLYPQIPETCCCRNRLANLYITNAGSHVHHNTVHNFCAQLSTTGHQPPAIPQPSKQTTWLWFRNLPSTLPGLHSTPNPPCSGIGYQQNRVLSSSLKLIGITCMSHLRVH